MTDLQSRRRALRSTSAALALIGLGGCTRPLAWPDLATLIERVAPSVVGVGDRRGISGSGFALQDASLVATAAHVVVDLKAPLVIRTASASVEGRIALVDEKADLALLRVRQPVSPTAQSGLLLAPAAPITGQWAVVLGCPFGTSPTATVGIVSALPGAVLEPPELARRMQLNAAVNPGNSGGPVVDLNGRVIGVANATVTGGNGLGFAVPAAELQTLLGELSRTGRGS